MSYKSKQHSNLGKSLIRDRFKGKNISRNDEDIIIPIDSKKSYNPIYSITEQGNLDEFLTTAELANVQFVAEKGNTQVVINNSSDYLNKLSSFQNTVSENLMREKYKQFLRLPRRPKWTSETSPSELSRMEKESFLNWRRSVALFQENNSLIMTPYEKNLEMWRQLWRVLEKRYNFLFFIIIYDDILIFVFILTVTY